MYILAFFAYYLSGVPLSREGILRLTGEAHCQSHLSHNRLTKPVLRLSIWSSWEWRLLGYQVLQHKIYQSCLQTCDHWFLCICRFWVAHGLWNTSNIISLRHMARKQHPWLSAIWRVQLWKHYCLQKVPPTSQHHLVDTLKMHLVASVHTVHNC